MVSPFIRVSGGLWCALILGAQTPAPPPGPPSGVIAGTVMDAGNRQPIRRAIITLSTVEARPQDAVAWTDATGRFAFGYLPAGRYEVRVTKDGYQAAAYGAETPRRPPGTLQLAAGEVRNDLAFRLKVVSTISGVVTDADGDPLANVQIMAVRPGWQRGKRQLLPAGGASTDRNGRYQLRGVPAGRYVLAAQLLFVFGPALRIPPEAADGEAQLQYSYAPQYYPGTDRPETAATFTVEPGQDYEQIDFQLTAQPGTAVQGKVVLPPGIKPPQSVFLTAVSNDLGQGVNRGAPVGQDLSFRFDQLPPGSYTIAATATIDGRAYRGVAPVATGSDGGRDLAIMLRPGIDLSGSVSVEGPEAAKHAPGFVALVPGDGVPWNGAPLRANVGKDGSFTITGVPPGIWDINAGPIPPGGYIKSMRLGDQDVLTEEMSIQSSTQAPLKIVLGTRAAAVLGEVTKDGQAARATVLLAPEAKFRHVLSWYRFVAADATGHFEIKGITPGTYQLFAFEEFDPQSIQDPEFLKPFEPEGVTVTLKEGDNPPQKLSPASTNAPEPRAGGEAQ